MDLPFSLENIAAKQGFFKLDSCFGVHVNTPTRMTASEAEVESFESPLFVIHQLSYQNVIQAYIIEPFYKYVSSYYNVLVLRRIKSVKNIHSPVKVTHSLGPLSVVCDVDNSVAVFCIDTSSRPVT